MKVVVVYIYPLNGAQHPRRIHAVEFVDGYVKFPAEYEHELVVVSNGQAPNEDTKSIFSPCGPVTFFEHDNSGFDIGGFQHVARDVKADLMVFFGNSAYLRRAGWLKRMVESTESHGPDALYGSMQVTEAIGIGIWPHLRTTGFWINPAVMNRYPMIVTDPAQRYPFEHGPDSFTMWCARNVGCYVVTFAGVYDMNQWGGVPEGYHSGEQKELLSGDRMSRPPWYPFT